MSVRGKTPGPPGLEVLKGGNHVERSPNAINRLGTILTAQLFGNPVRSPPLKFSRRQLLEMSNLQAQTSSLCSKAGRLTYAG
jgi:hypothetical protein